jgi:integrase/recombinase XerD
MAPTALARIPVRGRLLTAEQFHALAEVPPEAEWFANLRNPHTREAYRRDVADFMAFVGIRKPEEFRQVTRAHVIAWRDSLAGKSPASIRRHLSALSSLMDYLCEANAIQHNPVDGVARPTDGANEGTTPAISDAQARQLLDAPPAGTLKGKRDRAILAVLLYHALRRAELCGLRVKDLAERRGVLSITVHGKRGKIRYVPVHPKAAALISDYLDASGHRDDRDGALFRPIKNALGTLEGHLTPGAIFSRVVRPYGRQIGIAVEGFGPHSLRTTAATNALEHDADIAKVQDWLGHANVSTTRLYDRRKMRPEESPTFRVSY